MPATAVRQPVLHRKYIESDRLVFRSPTGNVLASAPLAPDIDSDDPIAWIEDHLPCEHIDAKTGVTRWTGEKMDWDLAVAHLFPVGRPVKSGGE